MAIPALRLISTAALVGGLSVLAIAGDSLRFDVDPVFQGHVSPNGTHPFAVDIQNSGADARGVLRIATESGKIDYPVELPRGADKRLMTYPDTYYGDIQFSLITDHGTVSHTYPVTGDGAEGAHVLLIGDEPGELSFLTAASSNRNSSPGGAPTGNSTAMTTLLDCYAKPGACPTRPVGYLGVSIVILGSGSERLSDEEVRALRLWVTTGGTLVFLGGVSTPVLSDRRWADLLPAGNLHLAKLPADSAVLGNLGTVAAPAANVTTGVPLTGASGRLDDGVLLWSDMAHGLGKVTLLSFNPFESPFREWGGRGQALAKILRATSQLQASIFVDQFGGRGNTSGPNPVTAVGPATGYPATYGSIENDPFSMKLPPTSKICWVLAAYFVVVVPVNFLVLKKMKRGELAWFSAPVISLAFAGMLFQSAQGLYGAKMSTVSGGLVVGQEGDQDGMFIGNTEMFIPHAGSYDLNLKGVDSLGSEQSDDSDAMYDGSRNDEGEVAPVDVGEVTVPGLEANNLAFRRLNYRQVVPISKWMHVHLKPLSGEEALCVITNTSPYTLKDAYIAVGRRMQSIPDVLPGKETSAKVSFAEPPGQNDISNNDVRMFTVKKKRVALSGRLSGFRPGPQLGEDLAGRSDITLALFSDWEGAKAQ